MSILFNGSYVNTKQQLWASYASNSGSAGTASNLSYCNSSAYPGDIPTTIYVNLPTIGPYPIDNNFNSPFITLLNCQRLFAEDPSYPSDTSVINGNITYGPDNNLANYIDSFNIYNQDQYGVDYPVQIQGVPVYIQTNSRNDDRPYNGNPSFYLSAYGPTFNIGGSPTTGLIINNYCNAFDSTYGSGEGCMYVGDDGNLHWYNFNASMDNQLTPVGAPTNIYNSNNLSFNGPILNLTNTTDGTFSPSITIVEANLDNTTLANGSLFEISYVGTPDGSQSQVFFTNTNLLSGAFLPYMFQTSGDNTGALQLNNPANSSYCALYPDANGAFHVYTSGEGGIDNIITGMNPFSFNGALSVTANQASCPTELEVVYGTPPVNMFLQNNAIVSISINGAVTSPTFTQDMVILGFIITFYYSADYSTSVTLNTTMSAYVSNVLGEPYPFSCSLTELISLAPYYGGYVYNIGVEIIFNNGYITSGTYTFTFPTINVTVTPQN